MVSINSILLGCALVAFNQQWMTSVQASSLNMNPTQAGIEDVVTLDNQHPAQRVAMKTSYEVPTEDGKVKTCTTGSASFVKGSWKWKFSETEYTSYSETHTWSVETTWSKNTTTVITTSTTSSTDGSAGSTDGAGGDNNNSTTSVKQRVPKDKDSSTSAKQRAAKKARVLEAGATTSNDLMKLQNFFGRRVEVNFKRLKTSAEFSPQSTSQATPWPGSYWPTFQDGINVQWQQGQPSATEKYAKAFGLNVEKFTEAISRQNGILSQQGNPQCRSDGDCDGGAGCAKRKNDRSGVCIPKWFGVCHAWAPAAILEKEPRCPVTRNGVKFEVNDMKALITQVYADARLQTVFMGARYDGASNALDRYGRYQDPAERDVGPGFFHIVMANVMGTAGRSFVIDADAGSQVWNQPVRGYRVVQTRELRPDDAARQYMRAPSYRVFNPNAKRVMYVRTQFKYILESTSNTPLVSTGMVDQSTKVVNYEYLLEMNQNYDIIGGEWVGNSKKEHPDFVWFPTQKPDSSVVTGAGLSYANVAKMIQDSQSGC